MKRYFLYGFMLIAFGLAFYGCKEKACETGYFGSDCKSEIRSQYYGSFNTLTSCSTTYVMTISASSRGATFVEIGNIDKLGSTVFAQFDVSNQGVLLIPQQVSGGSTFQGSITFNSDFNSATITYTKTLGNGTILPSCSGTATK